GEPYVLFFVSAAVYLFNEVLRTTSLSPRRVAATGAVLGLLVLSRQWGFFVFPAIVLLFGRMFITNRQQVRLRATQFLFMFMIAGVVGGWYYLHLFLANGTFTAFNIPSPRNPTSNDLISYYRDLHLSDQTLFQRPVWPVFGRSFFPILYSET